MLNKIRSFSFFVGLLISRIFASNDTVTVYVWDPKGTNVGHVSLKTKKSYISIWPAESISLASGVFGSPAKSLPSYAADKAAEEGDANHTYFLTLNSKKIDSIWENFIHNAILLEDGSKLLRNVEWFGPSGGNIASLNQNKINVNCASSVILALGAGGLNIDYFERKIFQKPSRTSEEARDLVAQAAGNPTQLETHMACCTLALSYLDTVKPQNVSAFVQRYIDETIGTQIENIINKKIDLQTDDQNIEKQDAISYFIEQLSKHDSTKRNKVRDENWIIKKYLSKFLDQISTSDNSSQQPTFKLKESTKKAIKLKMEQRQRNRMVAAGGVLVLLIAFLWF